MAAKELHNIITIDNEDYSITANKVARGLTIKVGNSETTFDGSEEKSVNITKSALDLANVTNDAQVKRSEMGVASGVATLGTDGKVLTSQLPSGALNQNAFSTIAVSGQTSVAADTATDTLTLVAGNNITITTNATNDSITIAATGGSGGTSDTANKINVAMDAGSYAATISIKSSDPTGGNIGDIWFKY
jgi:hypothetical protein